MSLSNASESDALDIFLDGAGTEGDPWGPV